MTRPPKTLSERFWAKVNKDGPVAAHRPELGPCWLWTSATNEHGYGVIRPVGKRSGPCLKAHRVAAEFAGMDITDSVVRHACDNPPCVNPAHLLTGSHAENIHDMHERGRGNVGSVNGQAKLTDEKVREIRALLACGFQGKTVAVAFGITPPTMSAIKLRQTWRHVPANPPLPFGQVRSLAIAVLGEAAGIGWQPVAARYAAETRLVVAEVA